jgi:hypothetical protein
MNAAKGLGMVFWSGETSGESGSSLYFGIPEKLGTSGPPYPIGNATLLVKEFHYLREVFFPWAILNTSTAASAGGSRT